MPLTLEPTQRNRPEIIIKIKSTDANTHIIKIHEEKCVCDCVSASVKLIEQENGRLIQFLFFLLFENYSPNENGQYQTNAFENIATKKKKNEK